MPDQRLDPFTSYTRAVTGSNVGNMLFQQAVIKTLTLPDNELECNGYHLRPGEVDRINASCDALVLPFANQFRTDQRATLVQLAETVERLRVPVIVVGIGCQTDPDHDYSNLDPIKDEVKRFVGAVLDRSASIGVRGAWTAEYLCKLGFRDVEVIGCPSMYLHGAALPTPRPVARFGRDTRLTVNVSAPSTQAEFSVGLAAFGQALAGAVQAYDDVDYVPQQNNTLGSLLLGRLRSTDEHQLMPPPMYSRLHQLGRVTTFVDPQTWIEHLRSRQFVFGTRLHGVIAAVLAGTPAHLVAHDSRTLELARFHGIAHTEARDLDAQLEPGELYERSNAATLLDGHSKRFETYLDFFRKNGLRNTYTDGDGGIAFEARMASIKLPGPVTSRLSWARRSQWLAEFATHRILEPMHRPGRPTKVRPRSDRDAAT
ncbi:MAG TPA: polysaccharide pyruvyl transferase family protein [Ilumatobacteraceae bacterium]|nr:polysaccharide pyruvyl transferase family protein [Ilumatobacteraceae bacterium]